MKDNLSNFIKKISKGSIKYSDPRKLNIDVIDNKIKKAIKNINSSDKIWTLWSCQGHKDKQGITLPYITFVVRKKNVKHFLKLFFTSLPLHINNKFPVSPSHYFTINRGFSDENFVIISIHWSRNFVEKDSKKLHRNLLILSKKIRKF